MRRFEIVNIFQIIIISLYFPVYADDKHSVIYSNMKSNVLEYCLVDLRISELLSLKSSLDKIDRKDGLQKNISGNTIPMIGKSKINNNCTLQPTAMALQAENRGYKSSYAENGYHQSWPEEKPSKLQTLFNISITALSFLSFGGYLLCLIVQTIKSKGTTYFHPITTESSAITNGNTKRIKVYRRGRRSLDIHSNELMDKKAYYQTMSLI